MSATVRSRVWARVPRHTVRARLTAVYVGLFLISGAFVLLVANIGLRTSATVSARVDPGGGAVRFVPVPPRPDPVVSQHVHDVSRLAASSVLALLVMVVLSIGIGWWVAGRMLRPLRTITTTAQAISASNLNQRLALDGPKDEFRELGDTLDGLLGRLEASFASQRHFVANASHELRTPLTAERALLQVALADPDASVESLRSAAGEVLALGAQQERLIDALLTLATSERGIERRDRLDVGSVADAAVAARAGAAAAGHLLVEATFGPAPAVGDGPLVESLVGNLVENAMVHNIDGGRVEITTLTDAGHAVLRVGNTGPVVPPVAVAGLFEPFRQQGERRRADGGHGLGLAIVAAIATAHGASVAASARVAGGLDVTVIFPVVPPDHVVTPPP